jgi:hypothetical protein
MTDKSVPFPGKSSMTEFMTPSQDRHGHSAVLHVRVPPGLVRDFEKLMVHKENFGWETLSDFMRWCLRYGFDYAVKRTANKQLMNLGAERRAVEDMVVEEMMQLNFEKDMERIEGMVRLMEDKGHREPMIRTLIKIQTRIKNIDDPYWRKYYGAEFKKRFGRYVKPVSLTEFNQDEDEDE